MLKYTLQRCFWFFVGFLYSYMSIFNLLIFNYKNAYTIYYFIKNHYICNLILTNFISLLVILGVYKLTRIL